MLGASTCMFAQNIWNSRSRFLSASRVRLAYLLSISSQTCCQSSKVFSASSNMSSQTRAFCGSENTLTSSTPIAWGYEALPGGGRSTMSHPQSRQARIDHADDGQQYQDEKDDSVDGDQHRGDLAELLEDRQRVDDVMQQPDDQADDDDPDHQRQQ